MTVSNVIAPSIKTARITKIGMNAERAFFSVMALLDYTGEGWKARWGCSPFDRW